MTDAITCFYIDNEMIVIGTRKALIRAFHIPLGDSSIPIRGYIHGHSKPVIAMASRDSDKRMVTVDTQGELILWNTMTGSKMASEKASAGISSIIWMDSNTVVTAGFDKLVKVYHIKKRIVEKRPSSGLTLKWLSKKKKEAPLESHCFALQKNLKGHDGEVYCIVAIDSNQFATGATDHTVKLWNLSSGHCTKSLKGHTDVVTCLAYSKQSLYSGSLDKCIRKWDLSTGSCLQILAGHCEWVKTLCVHENYLISGGWDETIYVHQCHSGQLLHRYKLDLGPILQLSYHGSRIYAVCRQPGTQHYIHTLYFGPTFMQI